MIISIFSLIALYITISLIFVALENSRAMSFAMGILWGGAIELLIIREIARLHG